MTTICKYCNEPENKQFRPGLICDTCICFVHLTCLRRLGTPGDLACDVFFDFTCEECSPSNKEVFIRNRFPWVNVILLTLHHLTTNAYGISNHGFFHYKTHICSFIDRNWNILFDSQFKQKKNWVGTIAGALSVYSNLMFRSGSSALGETGWWRLQHAFSPAVASHIIQEIARDKQKGRPRSQMALDITLFIEKVTEMGYREYLKTVDDELPPGIERAPFKKRRLELDYNTSSSASFYDQLDSDSRQDAQEEGPAAEGSCSEGDGFRGFYQPPAHLPPSDSSSVHSQQQALYEDSESRSPSPRPEPVREPEPERKPERKKPEEQRELTRESLFSTELNSLELPWEENFEVKEQKDLVDLTQYEEVQLLKQVENLIPKVKDPEKKAYLHRLRAKLALRRLKRHKHLPIFNLDRQVRALAGQAGRAEQRPAPGAARLLDRFRRCYLQDNLCGTIPDTNYGVTVLSSIEPVPFRSAFSHALLKPYIRRDSATPLWLKVMDELLVKTHRHVQAYAPPPHATVDYSYVRPHHIAAVNNLCAQYFWPGIDLTEALQYPEFSCVVSYRRLVVGCAFLVPGARAAYISFVLVRPEWRRAGLARFMLYHLLQTCTGKDVTLHVSPTNPAIFLYQKFGFKVEELIQDFYEKYYDIDYKGCRHALFLRLTR